MDRHEQVARKGKKIIPPECSSSSEEIESASQGNARAQSRVAKRMRLGSSMTTNQAGFPLCDQSRDMVPLIAEYLILEDFTRLRSTCKVFRNVLGRRHWYWQTYVEAFPRGIVRQLTHDNYEFILSPFHFPTYQANWRSVPRSHFPNSQDLLVASIRVSDPDILIKLPLRLINAFGGLAALAKLPCGPLLPEHFVDLTSQMQIVDNSGRIAAGQVLSFTPENTVYPIQIFHNSWSTVLVLRLRLTSSAQGPVHVLWYTCCRDSASGTKEWYCEMQLGPRVQYVYRPFPLNTVVGSLHRPGPSAVQEAQFPQSVLSFLRPSNGRCLRFMRDAGNSLDDGGFKNLNDQHSSPWDAVDFLRTLVFGRSVCSISRLHEELYVTLTGDPPSAAQLSVALLDWSHTQIQLPLTLETTRTSWAATFLEPVLRERRIYPVYLHLNDFQRLCDDEHYPLTADDAAVRMRYLLDSSLDLSPLEAMHALFSKGFRGFDVRMITYICYTVHEALCHLKYGDPEHEILLADPERLVTWLAHRLEHTRLGNTELGHFPSWWWQPLFNALLQHNRHLYDPNVQPTDWFYEDHGYHNPMFMCNICAKRHWPEYDTRWHGIFTGSTHATRARLLRSTTFPNSPLSDFNQHDILCVPDPEFSEQLRQLIGLAYGKFVPLRVLLHVPAYHAGSAQRYEVINTLSQACSTLRPCNRLRWPLVGTTCTRLAL